MNTANLWARPKPSSSSSPDHRSNRWVLVTVFAVVTLGVIVIAPSAPSGAGLLLTVGVIGVGLVVLGLRSPFIAIFYLLVTMFLRLALPDILPVDPFLIAYAGVIASVLVWMAIRPHSLPRLGVVEALMALYLLWNIYSMVAAHRYQAATYPLTGDVLSVDRFILTGTAIPFTMYLVGRMIYVREIAVRYLLWTIAALGAYSGLVSILQFHGPKALVWPRYIVDASNWPGRANGVFNQPAVNGLTLIAGFLAAVLLAGQAGEPRWRKIVANLTALVAAYGVYLTHTRAVWLSFFVIVVVGATLAKGMRSGFVATLGVILASVAVNWSSFISSDRSAGGVGSANELEDRLNSAATSFWAFYEEPWTGWGIARFTAVNTLHHKQWATDVPWIRGYGISSHFNELGILVELGLIGLALWIAVLVLVIRRLFVSYKTLPPQGLLGKNLVLMTMLVFGTLIITGLTVDLRYFDYPNAMVMLLVGVAVGQADHRRDNAESAAAAVRRTELRNA